MKTVFKFPVHIEDRFTVEMPTDAVFVSVQMQHDRPQMWFLVDTDKPVERRTFFVCGTGNPMHPEAANPFPLGSFQLYTGDLIFHLFTK